MKEGETQTGDEVEEPEAEQHDEQRREDGLGDPFRGEGEGRKRTDGGFVVRVVAPGVEIATASDTLGD